MDPFIEQSEKQSYSEEIKQNEKQSESDSRPRS